MLLVFKEYRLRILFCVLQCTFKGYQRYPAQNINSAKTKKPCSRSIEVYLALNLSTCTILHNSDKLEFAQFYY
jgi:hypothetical protein